MGNHHSDARNLGPLAHTDTTGVDINRHAADVVASHTACADRGAPITGVDVQNKLCRQLRLQLCCCRLVAASAIVAGLLLGTASWTLAQAQSLIASASAFTQGNSTQEISATADQEAGRPGDQSDDNRSDAHAVVTPLLSWQATTRAIRCVYGLLVEGNTRACHHAA